MAAVPFHRRLPSPSPARRHRPRRGQEPRRRLPRTPARRPGAARHSLEKRQRGGALFPNQASCRVLRPRLDTRWHRGYPIASRRPSGHGAFSSACKPRDRASGRRGVFFCVQLGALGGARPFSECASRERRPWRGVRPRYQKAPRQATFVSTVLLKHGRRPGCCSHAWRGALRLDQWPKRRARRPGTEQSRLNVKLLRGVSGPGAAPFLLVSAPAAKVAAGLHGNPIEGVKEACRKTRGRYSAEVWTSSPMDRHSEEVSTSSPTG
jgi:hypothetical protein